MIGPITSRLEELLPRWMQTSPRLAFGSLMAGFAALLDGLYVLAQEARLAAIPGQVDLPDVPGMGGFDSVDALPLIARDRGVVVGMSETPAQTAGRCRRWLDDWANDTGPFGLLRELALVLVPDTPVLRLVTTNGTVASWYTRETDGTLRLQRSDGVGFYLSPDGTSGADATRASNWIWTGSSTPEPPDAGDYSHFWIIIYAPASSPYLTATGGVCGGGQVCGATWNALTTVVPEGSPWAATLGTNAPIELVERIRAVIAQRRAAGALCEFIVVTTEATDFAPGGTSPIAYPDGTWGYPGKLHLGSNRVPTRDATSNARFWPGAPGGLAL